MRDEPSRFHLHATATAQQRSFFGPVVGWFCRPAGGTRDSSAGRQDSERQHVSFDREAMRRAGNGRPPDDPRGRHYGRRQQQRLEARPSWTPYIVGALIMLVGPLRPLVLSLLKETFGDVFNPSAEKEPAWYDA